jgi:AcrR family transcriptional regulator
VARTVKPEEYAAKRSEILRAAHRLVFQTGYEQMTIQDLLDDLHMSIGAFYHYFDSKQTLLDALVHSMLDEMVHELLPVVENPTLSALAKLPSFFATMYQWRLERQDALRALARVWYSDENAEVRQRLRSVMLTRLSELLSQIVTQGIAEGTITTDSPVQVSQLVVYLRMGLSETLGTFLGGRGTRATDLASIEATIAVYTKAIEHALGLSPGSVILTEADVINAWFITDTREGVHK